MGRRVGKTVNGQTIQYLYDKQQAIAEILGSAISVTYLTGLQLDEVLARYAGTGNKTLLTDALGSVIAQANDQQGIQNFYAYTPYGEVQPLGPDDNNPIQYTARENDQTGLYYYRARYYDPVLKRFISEDPIGLAGGANVYSYVSGNPVSFDDPSGLIVGNLITQALRRFTGQTAEEAAYGGKILDVGIGAAAGDVPNCIGGTDISTPRDLLRGFGGAQAIALSTATTYGLYGAGATISSAGAATALPLFLAGYGGVEVGRSFNSLYERSRGNSLGSDIYDLVNHRRLFSNPTPPRCGCQN